IYIIDSFGQMQQLSLSFNNDNSKEETETITPKQ
ncbi:conjugal transfer protein, partial [Bacteroides ovatus]